MNVEIGTEVAQFPGKEYINGFYVAVYHCVALQVQFDIQVHLFPQYLPEGGLYRKLYYVSKKLTLSPNTLGPFVSKLKCCVVSVPMCRPLLLPITEAKCKMTDPNRFLLPIVAWGEGQEYIVCTVM